MTIAPDVKVEVWNNHRDAKIQNVKVEITNIKVEVLCLRPQIPSAKGVLNQVFGFGYSVGFERLQFFLLTNLKIVLASLSLESLKPDPISCQQLS